MTVLHMKAVRTRHNSTWRAVAILIIWELLCGQVEYRGSYHTHNSKCCSLCMCESIDLCACVVCACVCVCVCVHACVLYSSLSDIYTMKRYQHDLLLLEQSRPSNNSTFGRQPRKTSTTGNNQTTYYYWYVTHTGSMESLQSANTCMYVHMYVRTYVHPCICTLTICKMSR